MKSTNPSQLERTEIPDHKMKYYDFEIIPCQHQTGQGVRFSTRIRNTQDSTFDIDRGDSRQYETLEIALTSGFLWVIWNEFSTNHGAEKLGDDYTRSPQTIQQTIQGVQ